MEENNTFEMEMQLTETAKGFLKEIAKWAYFLSIVGYVMIGFIVLAALSMGTIFSNLDNMAPGMQGLGSSAGVLITVLYLLIAALYFFPVYYLNKFASNLKSAFRDDNTEALTTSFEYLKSHYKFIGIMTIVVLALYALIFVFAIIMGGMAAFAS